MGIFDIFKGFISPAMALGIVRNQLQKSLKKDVPCFDVTFIPAKNSITFTVDGITYPFENEELKKMIQSKIKDFLKAGQTLDCVNAHVDASNAITGKIFFTENDKKQYTNFIF